MYSCVSRFNEDQYLRELKGGPTPYIVVFRVSALSSKRHQVSKGDEGGSAKDRGDSGQQQRFAAGFR